MENKQKQREITEKKRKSLKTEARLNHLAELDVGNYRQESCGLNHDYSKTIDKSLMETKADKNWK